MKRPTIRVTWDYMERRTPVRYRPSWGHSGPDWRVPREVWERYKAAETAWIHALIEVAEFEPEAGA